MVEKPTIVIGAGIAWLAADFNSYLEEIGG